MRLLMPFVLVVCCHVTACSRHVPVRIGLAASTVDACTSLGKGAEWRGVIYAPHGEDRDCGVPTPVEAPKAYDSACRSGWVHVDEIEVVAG